VSPPRVQAAWTITPAEGAVRPLIVRIRVRSLINAWSAVCLVLIWPKYARRSPWRMQTCSVSDAPRYRLWPPIDVGVPLVLGLTLTATLGDPVSLPHWLGPFGWLLVAAFALWNGWALVLMAKNRTAVLPGGPTRTVLDRGPFRVSRNPLYLGLLALHAGIALLWPSFWALVAVPVSAGLLLWGAIVPEEQYLKVKFGAEYERYAARVRRWL
jgi:protein-S-isoprenylcysteine O-methyltransferase Ste14